MGKVDLKKEMKDLYVMSSSNVRVVNVPPMYYLAIDGQGNPNTSKEYKDAVEALFSLSYAIKFMTKKGEQGIDYGVMPLEGLWFVDDMREFSIDRKDNWKWTSMIMQPRYVTSETVEKAIKEVVRKKALPALCKVRFETFEEKLCVQILHNGPFSEEGPTVKKLHDFIAENGFMKAGKHHEIYLNDFNRTAPERLRTIIRQPVDKLV